MKAFEVGKALVELCKVGKEMDALATLYHDDAVSIEARPGNESVAKGMEAIKAKHEWWNSAVEMHSAEVEGPFPNHNDNQFACIFTMDATMKQANQRFQMKEVGLYTVENGKIIKEEFFYKDA